MPGDHDEVFAGTSRKKSLDIPGTQMDDLRRKRKQEKKMKRRMEEEEECKKKKKKMKRRMEEEECKKKKKKKKKKMEEEMVIIDEEDEREAPVVVESVTKKKKKHKSRTVEGSLAMVAVVNNGRHPAKVPSGKSKKLDRKTKTSVVVMVASTDCDTPDAAASQEEGSQREAGAGGTLVPLLPKGRKSRRKECEMAQTEKLESGAHKELLAELMTYIPDIRSRCTVRIELMLRLDLLRFRAFKEKGIEVRWGRFLKTENLKIHDNVTNFLEVTGIATGNELFFPKRYPERAANIKKLRVQHCFMKSIAEDVPRPCYKVYDRAKKIYDDLNYLGRFTKDEDHQLMKLHRIHGNDWRNIGPGMDRSSTSVAKRFNMISSASGPWSREEVASLVAPIKVYLEMLAAKNQPGSDTGSGSTPEPLWLMKQQLCNKLPWMFISEKVRGRSWLQCREKWFSLLKPKLKARQKGQISHGVLPKIHLINTLYGMDMEDPAEIDWEKVANCLGAHMMPHHAQKLFNQIKITKVPHSSLLSFCELMDFLHDKLVPKLQEMIKADDVCPLQEEEEEENGPEKYLLSHIFTEEAEEEFIELDNTR